MKIKLPWWDRLNGMLMPYIGPPPLGPYNEAPLPAAGSRPCPLCGKPMDRHEIERGEGRVPTRIHCPSTETD
jgi:hypothetical protein